MSTATSLLGSKERLAHFLASPAALLALSGDTATEGTVLIKMADIDGLTGSEVPEPVPETDEN